MSDDNEFRTTLGFSTELLEKIDDCLHQAKKRGEVSRNTHRNPFILQLLQERCDELLAQHAKPASQNAAKKRSTT